MADQAVNFTFELLSRKHGRFSVTAPARFRREIESYTWRVDRNPERAPGKQFAVRTDVGGVTVRLHNLIASLAGMPASRYRDHVDGDPMNNAEDNIRPATASQNAWNRPLQRTSISGFKGVSWNASVGKWHARLTANKRCIQLGYFDDPMDASNAYVNAARNLHGEFARVSQ